MADKIKSSYKFSKSFYDDAINQGKWWSKLYFKLLWGGVDDNEIARRVLSWIPDDFNGKLLDVPMGTAVFTTEKYKRMTQADITCLDYSLDCWNRQGTDSVGQASQISRLCRVTWANSLLRIIHSTSYSVRMAYMFSQIRRGHTLRFFVHLDLAVSC